MVTFNLAFGNWNWAIAQNYWVQKAGSPLIDEGLDISKDASGNVYSTGYFAGTAVLDSSLSLSSAGSTDIFIAKYNAQGILQWAVQAGGNLPDKGLAIKTDDSGNSYVTGFFYGTATFGTITVSASGNSQDVFIAKYSTNGNLLWVKQAGGNNGDIGNGIACDNSGNVFITGEFSDAAQFGSFSLSSMINPTTQLPSVDIFIAKLDTSGNFSWAKKGSAKYTDRGLDIVTDISGNVYTTGQFSDTISFDNTYNNNSYNTIFLTKHDPNGNEIWFRRAGGGIQNIAYAIAIDNLNNIYLSGDAKGNILFWGSTLTYLNTAFSNNIFVAKYDSNGTLIWVTDNGSDNPVTARNIALDNDGNPFVIGNFKCDFTEYSNTYGSGIFNSIGFNDIYISKFSTSGNWLWSRQCGGKEDDFGNGIVVDNAGLPLICGSFRQKIFFPSASNFAGNYLAPAFSQSYGYYCNDQNYNKYMYISSFGNSDIITGKAVDFNRQPYDYYNRSGTVCNRDYIGICINSNCPDSLVACNFGTLYANTNTSYSVGPSFNYLWSQASETNSAIIVNQSGIYHVTVTTSDGCFSSTDSIAVIINPLPSKPTITDDVVINNNAQFTQTIELCEPDSVTLTGGNYSPGNIIQWEGFSVDSSVITVSTSGEYIFSVTDSNGCKNVTSVSVYIYPMLPPFDPHIILLEGNNDSIAFCKGRAFQIQLFDGITNPDTSLDCFPLQDPYSTITTWDPVPDMPISTSCETFADFYPDTSGQVDIDVRIIRFNICDTDTFYLNKTVYVEIYPLPEVELDIFNDRDILCPAGDSILLIASGWTEYEWQTPSGIQTGDSIWASDPGSYSIYVSDTNSYGCTTGSGENIVITYKPQPQIYPSPASALLCPDSSVLLTVNLIAPNYDWFGPSGQILSNAPYITVTSPGFYLCLVTDSENCVLTSNSIEVKEYATPFLVVTPSDTVCPGNTAILTVVTNPGSLLQWETPLSGSALYQAVNETGTYTCNVTSCGVITPVSTFITASNTVFQLSLFGTDTFCDWDSSIISATPGLSSYAWNTGEIGTDSITVTQSGDYFVTATDSFNCVFYSEIISIVSLASPENPVADAKTVCKGSSAILNATGTGTIEWFETASGGNIIASGETFTTSEINSEMQFFVQSNNGGICPSERILVTVLMDPVSLMQVELTAQDYLITLGDSTQLTANCPACLADPFPNFSWSPPSSITDSRSLYPVASPVETTTYTFIISDPGKSTCTVLDTITIEVKPLICGEPEIFVPNAFTPNNDNQNELLFVRGNKIKTMYFVVLDRWGEKIFETENQSLAWDGTYNGMKCDPAVFVYYLKGTCIDGQELFMKGNVTLIK